MPLLHLPLPSLVSLRAMFPNPPLFQNSLKSFPNSSPNIRRLHLIVRYLEHTFITLEPNYICRWQNLCSVTCPDFALDMDTLTHLSRMPALTELAFALSTALPLPVSDSPLFFSTLRHFRLNSKSWSSISQLLSQTHMPAITKFTAFLHDIPSRQELRAFFAGTFGACGRTIKRFNLKLWKLRLNDAIDPSEIPSLCLEDLQSFMAFSNLHCLEFDVEWNVGLTDAELLALASAWPRLKILCINKNVGWKTPGGITPHGLIQLLDTCRSLRRIAIAVDTRGYTGLESPSGGSLADLASRSLLLSCIDVIDSMIEEDSVSAIATFFASIPRSSRFKVWAWSTKSLRFRRPDWRENHDRWEEVYKRVKGANHQNRQRS